MIGDRICLLVAALQLAHEERDTPWAIVKGGPYEGEKRNSCRSKARVQEN